MRIGGDTVSALAVACVGGHVFCVLKQRVCLQACATLGCTRACLQAVVCRKPGHRYVERNWYWKKSGGSRCTLKVGAYVCGKTVIIALFYS